MAGNKLYCLVTEAYSDVSSSPKAAMQWCPVRTRTCDVPGLVRLLCRPSCCLHLAPRPHKTSMYLLWNRKTTQSNTEQYKTLSKPTAYLQPTYLLTHGTLPKTTCVFPVGDSISAYTALAKGSSFTSRQCTGLVIQPVTAV